MSVFIVHKKEFIFILLFSIIYIIKIYLSNKLKAYFYNDILNDISQINLILIYLIEKKKVEEKIKNIRFKETQKKQFQN